MSFSLACIYLITNCLNGKRYVGKSKNVQQRWYGHKRGYNGKHCENYCKKPSKLDYDIYKYGESNFKIEILHSFNTFEQYLREGFFYECHYMSELEPEYNIAFGSGRGNTNGLNYDDEDYVEKARTTWATDMKRFRENYNTLEKYTAHYRPQATTGYLDYLERLGVLQC